VVTILYRGNCGNTVTIATTETLVILVQSRSARGRTGIKFSCLLYTWEGGLAPLIPDAPINAGQTDSCSGADGRATLQVYAPHWLVRDCYLSGETLHVFRVAQRDLDQFTRRHAVRPTDITVAVHGLVSPRAGIFYIILFKSKELKRISEQSP